MTKLSEKYRARADLYAYLESRPSDCDCADCHCTVIDDGDGLKNRENLHRELSASSVSSPLLAAGEACGIQIYRYTESGKVSDFEIRRAE